MDKAEILKEQLIDMVSVARNSTLSDREFVESWMKLDETVAKMLELEQSKSSEGEGKDLSELQEIDIKHLRTTITIKDGEDDSRPNRVDFKVGWNAALDKLIGKE